MVGALALAEVTYGTGLAAAGVYRLQLIMTQVRVSALSSCACLRLARLDMRKEEYKYRQPATM